MRFQSSSPLGELLPALKYILLVWGLLWVPYAKKALALTALAMGFTSVVMLLI